jgi:hypothetical protein
MPPRSAYLSKKQKLFVAELAKGRSVTAAAEVVKLTRRAVYKWRKEKPRLAEAWDDALEVGVDRLEDIARDRAVAGSDGLLTMLLKCKRPKIYNPPPPAPELPSPVYMVEFKVTTVYEALARVRQLGLPKPEPFEGDFEDDDKK